MSWVGVAVGVGGAIIQGNAAGDATKANTRASNSSIKAQQEAEAAANARAQPFADIGLAAGDPLLELLGLQANPDFSVLDDEIKRIQSQLALDTERSSGPGGLIGGLFHDKRFEGVPEIDRGSLETRLDQLLKQKSGVSQFLKSDTIPGLAEINPLVDILRDQGFERIQETAAAGGRLGAGGTLKDLTQFNNDLATTVVPQLQNQRFNQLFNVLGLGSNAATNQGTNSLNTASNISNLLGQQGTAQANGAINQSNALTNGLSNISAAFGANPSSGGTAQINQNALNNSNFAGGAFDFGL